MADPGRYLAGVGIALCTTAMSALGMSLQKLSHQRLEAARESARRRHKVDPKLAAYRQPLWITGIVLMAASSLLSLAVFALVGQSVASAFASITIVWNMILAVSLLRERITPLDILVAGLCISGTILTVYFGSKGAGQGSFLSLNDILTLIKRPAAIAGWVVFGLAVLAFGGYTVAMDRALFRGTVTRRDASFRVTIFTRAVTAGTFSGFVGFFSKAVVSIFAKSTQNVSANLGRWEVWIFLILLPVALVFQVSFLNSSLRSFPAAEAVPLYQSMVVVMGVIFGWTLYNEAAGKTGGQVVGFICGILVILLGICLLLTKRRPVAVTLSVLDAVKALAVGELLVQVTGLRRARTAPDSLVEMEEDALLRCRKKGDCDVGPLRQFRAPVPVQTSRGSRLQSFYLVKPDSDSPEPVSPRELLRGPAVERTGGSGASDEQRGAQTAAQQPARRVPPALTVNVLMPAVYTLMSEPARDRR